MHTAKLFELKDKVAIVTGGAIGLGRQMAEALAEMGAKVVLAARNVERCQTAAEELAKLGTQTLAVGCDVTKPEDVQRLVDQTMDRFGRIDILVNNSGMSWGGKPEDLALADWNNVLAVNVTGAFLCAQLVGRVMIEQKGGRIINVASIEGLVGCSSDIAEAIAYNTSKGALINFTRDLACKWAKHNIGVNALAPGWFPTHMTDRLFAAREQQLLNTIPLQRFGKDDELKGAIVFLASDAASYMTGQVLVVDGGTTAW